MVKVFVDLFLLDGFSGLSGCSSPDFSLRVGLETPRGRPRKTWKKTVEEDMRLVGVREEDALDRGR